MQQKPRQSHLQLEATIDRLAGLGLQSNAWLTACESAGTPSKLTPEYGNVQWCALTLVLALYVMVKLRAEHWHIGIASLPGTTDNQHRPVKMKPEYSTQGCVTRPSGTSYASCSSVSAVIGSRLLLAPRDQPPLWEC
jgi:hypothetical protein